METTIPVDRDHAKKLFDTSNSDGRAAILQLVGFAALAASMKPMDILNSINNVDDAFRITGDKKQEWIRWENPVNEKQKRDNARDAWEQIIKAVTGDWIPDYGNDRQPKWHGWLEWDKEAGAFRFWCSVCVDSFTSTGSGAPFVFPTEELMIATTKKFLPIINAFMIKK